MTNQDKVEFKILFTCVSFSTKNRINKELKKILSKNEKKIFYKCLKDLNYEALKQKEKDKKLIEHLVLRQIQIDKSNIYEIDKIYWLVEDCKKYGTLPFAGLARCGFIAIDLLKSLKENKFINDSDYSAFLNSIETVTSKMKNDINKYPKGKFIKKWVPELRNVSDIWIHEPWKMDSNTQKTINCYIGKHYPEPIVNHLEVIKKAKSKMALILKKEGYMQGSNSVLNKLGSKRVKKIRRNTCKQLQLI